MSTMLYPFAYIVGGEYKGNYVYAYRGRCYLIQYSSFKQKDIGIFTLDTSHDITLKHNHTFSYEFSDIVGYEIIGSIAVGADANAVMQGSMMFGVAGALVAGAASANNKHDVAIIFKDEKKSIFRFLNSRSYQNYITGFYEANIKPLNQNNTNNTNSTAPYEEIKKLKELLEIGAITQEEFDEKKKQLLGL